MLSVRRESELDEVALAEDPSAALPMYEAFIATGKNDHFANLVVSMLYGSDWRENPRSISQRKGGTLAERVAKSEAEKKDKKRGKHGVSRAEKRALIAAQDGKCKCCGEQLSTEDNTAVHVDHCHTTGKIRGVLCRGCNLGIGHFRESVEALQRAIVYLSA